MDRPQAVLDIKEHCHEEIRRNDVSTAQTQNGKEPRLCEVWEGINTVNGLPLCGRLQLRNNKQRTTVLSGMLP